MGFSIGKVFKPIEEYISKIEDVDSIYLPIPNYSPMGLLKNIRASIKAIKNKKYDIIHITGSEYYLLPFLKKHKTVVTIHDLGFYTNHKRTLKSIWIYISRIRTLKNAKLLTFISNKSKSEAEELINIKNKRYIIIPNAVGSEYIYTKKNINTEHPIVLQIGTKINKNLENTIKALRGLTCHLRIIGPLSDAHKKLLQENKIEYSQTQNLSNQEILQEYINCDIVMFPSYYEGFGMPIIEGQAVGRVVITSNISPMKDIAGNSAVIVDPHNATSIRDGYIQALKEYKTYQMKGLKNARLYNVNHISQMYLNSYISLINSYQYDK